MLKWFFLRDDCDILRNLFLEHHMFANEGSIHSNNSRRMNAAAACVLSPFFPFYLRTLSQSLLSRTSASQCLILLVTGGGPDICHYVFCRQIVYLHILHFAYLYSAYLHIFGHFSLHVLSSDLLFAYFALSCC